MTKMFLKVEARLGIIETFFTANEEYSNLPQESNPKAGFFSSFFQLTPKCLWQCALEAGMRHIDC